MGARLTTQVRKTFSLGIAAALLIVTLPAQMYAVQPSDGFFYGIEMDPVGNAAVTALETEPAVVLIFAAEQKTAEVTRQFNEWYNSPSRPAVEVYAIAVEPGTMSRDVLLEAINQRNLQMPVFLARSDMLLGDDFRLVVLNDDQEVQRFTTLDAAGVNAALAGLGIAIPAPVATPPPVAAPAVVPPAPPAPAVAPVMPAPVPVDPSVDTETDSSTSINILGGPDGDAVYVNDRFGMSIQFPAGWRYQVSAQNDGAVAFEPDGSKMDMRLWAIPAPGIGSAQEYVDQTLKSLAEKNGTRVNVERKLEVTEEGVAGLDVTYNYTRLLDAAMPSRGGLLYRGRMQVFLDDGTIKAARVAAPSGEFQALFSIIDPYILSFKSSSDDIPAPTGSSVPQSF